MRKTRKPKRKARKPANEARYFIDAGGPFFLRFPPATIECRYDDWCANNLPALYLATDLWKGSQAEQNASIAIVANAREYQQTKNPLALMDAITESVQAGVYPPIEVLQALAALFTQFRQQQKSLDRVFGLTADTGGWTAGTRRRRWEDEYFLAHLLHDFKTRIHLSTAEAAARVEEHLRRHFENLDIKIMSAGTLAKRYPEWKRRFKLSDNTSLFEPLNTD
jgi:hypothetical protein